MTGEIALDKTDEKILRLMEDNGRISFQEIGDAVGMSRVAAKKRVAKLEREGVIRGYRACIVRDNEITMFIDIVTQPEPYEKILSYVSEELPFVREVYRTTKENHIHLVAVSDTVVNLKKVIGMLRKAYGGSIVQLQCHAVKETVKNDVNKPAFI